MEGSRRSLERGRKLRGLAVLRRPGSKRNGPSAIRRFCSREVAASTCSARVLSVSTLTVPFLTVPFRFAARAQVVLIRFRQEIPCPVLRSRTFEDSFQHLSSLREQKGCGINRQLPVDFGLRLGLSHGRGCVRIRASVAEKTTYDERDHPRPAFRSQRNPDEPKAYKPGDQTRDSQYQDVRQNVRPNAASAGCCRPVH
jgi:hypothetical protein